MAELEINPELVEVLPVPVLAGIEWQPSIGKETLKLLRNLSIPEDGYKLLQNEAIDTLGRCIPPTPPPRSKTGIVVGYVQSGKTISFTTVAALAHDNGYQLIIVVTGTSIPLLAQSTKRLKQDLQLDTRSDRKWQLFTNPSIANRDHLAIQDTLAEWNDETVPLAERRTVLITVMKNHRHLENLIHVLQNIDLEHVPALVIDDEADQASLNTLVQLGEQSTTYRCLLSIRHCLRHHTFLQYTATPQAPLLINIIDTLSPSFAQVLTPGKGYVGGRVFFIEIPNLIRTIPTSDIPTRGHRFQEPPESLISAMRLFFIGVAAGLIVDSGNGNRSMLVHPTQKTVGHRQYYRWVTQIKENWKAALEMPSSDPDYLELMADFEKAYLDIRATVPGLPTFDEISGRLLHAIRRTRVEEVNARTGQTPNIDWSAAYAYILVGGQAMDRGFTVEGLTVTYMPRGLGVGHADTVQQRARFFGYKQEYLGYCRVFLESNTADAYRRYVEHEEDVREKLLEHSRTGMPLSEWKRAFFLTSRLKPTRDNVLDLDYMRGNISNDWYRPKAPHDSSDAVDSNRNIVQQFLAQLDLQPDRKIKGLKLDRAHLVAKASLAKVYQELLINLRITRLSDSRMFTGVLLQIERYLETHPHAECTVYLMNRGQTRQRSVGRDRNERDEIRLFESHAASGSYPGDSSIRAENGITVQVHFLKVTETSDKNSPIIADNVPAVAVYLPEETSADWLVQEQNINR